MAWIDDYRKLNPWTADYSDAELVQYEAARKGYDLADFAKNVGYTGPLETTSTSYFHTSRISSDGYDLGVALPVTFVGVFIAFLVALGLQQLIGPSVTSSESFVRARKWAAWAVLIATVALLGRTIALGVTRPGAWFEPMMAWLVSSVLWGGVAFAAGFLVTKFRSGSKQIITTADPAPPVTQVLETIPPNVHTPTVPAQASEDLYAVAWKEISEGKTIDALWARAFAEADGDGEKAKAAYIRLRAAQGNH